MAYQSIPGASMSGGLNLRDSPDQLQPDQAYDLMNVVFTARGGVQSRPGYADWKTSITNRVDSTGAYFYSAGNAWQIAVGNGARLETLSNTGAAVGSAVTPTAYPHYFARFGGAADSYLFASNGTDQVRRWSGAASAWQTSGGAFTWSLSNSAPNPTGKFLAVTPWDNRLVNARYSGTIGGQNQSSVAFSDPYLPTTWDGFNWVDLVPGDGEPIMGMAVYGDNLMVFKRTKYFVFYGTSISSTGTAEFAYRAVEAGVGLAGEGLCCTANDGVYFVSNKGVYRTDGGAPELISDVIDPLFSGQTSVLYTGTGINFSSISAARITEHNKQIFLSVPTGTSSTNDTTLVFDPRYNWWSRWNLPASTLLSVDVSGTSSGPSLLFGLSTGSKNIEKVSVALSADAGAGITSWLKLGYTDFGVAVNKTVRESQLWGAGTLRFGLAKDFASSVNATTMELGRVSDVWADGSDATDLWGDGTTTDQWSAGQLGGVATARNAIRGLVLGVELYSSSASVPPFWSVNRLIHRMREQRVPSVQRTDR